MTVPPFLRAGREVGGVGLGLPHALVFDLRPQSELRRLRVGALAVRDAVALGPAGQREECNYILSANKTAPPAVFHNRRCCHTLY